MRDILQKAKEEHIAVEDHHRYACEVVEQFPVHLRLEAPVAENSSPSSTGDDYNSSTLHGGSDSDWEALVSDEMGDVWSEEGRTLT